MLITELNIVTQIQHQLPSGRQLTECLRNVPYLSKLFLAGNHVTFSKNTAEGDRRSISHGSHVVKRLIWRLENQESGIGMGAGVETGTGIGTGTE